MPIDPIAIALSERKVVSIDLEAHGILLYEMFAERVTEFDFPGTSAVDAFFFTISRRSQRICFGAINEHNDSANGI